MKTVIEFADSEDGREVNIVYWTDLPEGAPGTAATRAAFAVLRLLEQELKTQFQQIEPPAG